MKNTIILLKKAGTRDQQKKLLSILQSKLTTNLATPHEAASLITELYNKTTDPWLSGEIKRLQNRLRIKTVLGRDLLRLTTPPTEKNLRQNWHDLQHLKSTFNATSATVDFETKYDVLEKIGDGGMSVVFKAVYRADSQEVAIKYLREKYFNSPAIVARFQRECQLCLTFDHPHIIKTFEAGEHNGNAFMVMEYLPLAGIDTLLGHPDFSLQHGLEVIRQTVAALIYIHKKNIIHRDLKLSNLLLAKWEPTVACNAREEITVKLSDFGLSKVVSAEGLTTLGTVMGTEFYSSPEQRTAPGDVDARSDLYSLGVCMYRLLSGGMPVGNFPTLHDLHPQLPTELDALIMHCLKVNRDERLESIEKVAAQLDAVLITMP